MELIAGVSSHVHTLLLKIYFFREKMNEIYISEPFSCDLFFKCPSSDLICEVSKLLTVYISGEVAEYDEVGLIDGSADDPVQSVFIVNQNALLGHAVRNHPDTEQKHEEEQIHHLQREETTFIARSVCICCYAKICCIMRGSY